VNGRTLPDIPLNYLNVSQLSNSNEKQSAIVLRFQLRSVRYTAFQMKDNMQNTFSIKPVTKENMHSFHYKHDT